MYLQSESLELELEVDPFRIVDSLCSHLKQKKRAVWVKLTTMWANLSKSSLIVIHINNSRRSFNILNVKAFKLTTARVAKRN